MKDAQLKHLINRNNFMKSRITIFLLALFVTQFFKIALAEENSPDIKTVISEGVGIDPQSAAQNAAENALKQIVGSFMDSSTLLEKRTLIDSGIKSETKSISSNIKEYSQGSIKSFETVEVKPEGGLYKVTAKVSVRQEDFSVYVKKLASGTTQIDGVGMFANISTKANQLNNLTSIIYEKITKPINSGEVQEFEVGKPVLLSDFIKNNSTYNTQTQETSAIFKPEFRDNDSTIIFKVRTYLNPEFSKNIGNILKEISENHKVVNLLDEDICPNEKFCIKKGHNSETGISNFFTLNFKYENYQDFEISNIKIAIFDRNNEPIFISSKVGVVPDMTAHNYKAHSKYIKFNMDKYAFFHDANPWNLLRYGYGNRNQRIILDSMSFFVIVKLEPSILSKANKIVVSLGDFQNPNVILSESKSAGQNSETPSSTSVSTLGNDVTSTANLKTNKPKPEKSPKQLQALKTNAISDIKKKVSDNWSNLIKSADFSVLNQDVVSKFKCTVVATLSLDGSVTDVTLKESSGYGGFDGIAENVVKKSSPLPIAKDDDLFDSSFKTMTFIFDKNNVEVQTLN